MKGQLVGYFKASATQIDTEPGIWRHYVGPSGQALVLKPDLGVQLASGAARLAWFIEVDRSTESLKRIRVKARLFLDYWRSGLEQGRPEMKGTFPRVLWSVPDEKRAEAIGRTLAGLPEPASAMFAVATSKETARALLGTAI